MGYSSEGWPRRGSDIAPLKDNYIPLEEMDKGEPAHSSGLRTDDFGMP